MHKSFSRDGVPYLVVNLVLLLYIVLEKATIYWQPTGYCALRCLSLAPLPINANPLSAAPLPLLLHNRYLQYDII